MTEVTASDSNLVAATSNSNIELSSSDSTIETMLCTFVEGRLIVVETILRVIIISEVGIQVESTTVDIDS